MKKTLLISFFIALTFKGVAQDIIVKNDKTEIKTKITELTDDTIKYKKFEMLDGPIYNIKKSEVFMIIYQNGTKEYIENTKTEVPEVQNQGNTYTTPDQPSKQYNFNNSTSNSPSNNTAKKGSIGLAISGSTIDLESYFGSRKASNDFYWGFSLYGDLSGNSSAIMSLYPFLAYKLPLGNSFNFTLNAGYNMSWVEEVTSYTTLSNGYLNPEYSDKIAGSFLWEIGAEYYFTKHWGITAYFPEATGFWVGFVFRGR